MNSNLKWISVMSAIFFTLSVEGGAKESLLHKKPRVKGQVLFQLRNDIKSSDKTKVNQLLSRWKTRSQDFSLFSLSEMPRQKLKDAAIGTASLSEEQLAEQLMATGAVEYAEPNYIVYPNEQFSRTVNDPYYYYQWHHQTIQSEKAWEVTSGNSRVVVTVCDTGIDSRHPDLTSSLILPGFNVVDGSTITDPIHQHGTAVAGLITAKRNNSIGVVGIAPSVKVLPVKVSNEASGSAALSDLAECIRYGADRGAKVVNVSYGGAYSRAIDAAATYARSKGTLVIMAAGNDGEDITSYIPDYSSFLLVGATTPDEGLADFSNYGVPVDLSAPGQDIVTTTLRNSYIQISGTSFSAPIVSAVAALVYSVYPGFTAQQVEDILLQSATDVGQEYYFGKGRINASSAVELAVQRSR